MWRVCLAAGAVLATLAGCGTEPGSDPIAWWRQLEGGRLAQERPLPPNADAPYPNLATVPARPTATGAATRARIAAGLEGDRRDAAFAAAQPLVAPTPRPVAPVQPDPSGAIGASLAAASAAPTPAAAPPPAAAAAGSPAPPAAAPPAPGQPAPAQPAFPTRTPAAAPAPPLAPAAPPMPFTTMPAAPPAPPRLPGVAAVTRPVPTLRAPPPPPVVVPFTPGAPVALPFAPGSAILPEGAAASLRQLAATRAGRDIRVVAYGESADTDAASQEAVLPLAFARARAIATALVQAGVPESAILVAAEAPGRGAVARIAE